MLPDHEADIGWKTVKELTMIVADDGLATSMWWGFVLDWHAHIDSIIKMARVCHADSRFIKCP